MVIRRAPGMCWAAKLRVVRTSTMAGGGAEVADGRRAAVVDQPAELLDADAGEAQQLVEAAALPPLHHHQQRHGAQGEDHRPDAEAVQPEKGTPDRAVEQEAQG